jgi:hypothetical protein
MFGYMKMQTGNFGCLPYLFFFRNTSKLIKPSLQCTRTSSGTILGKNWNNERKIWLLVGIVPRHTLLWRELLSLFIVNYFKLPALDFVSYCLLSPVKLLQTIASHPETRIPFVRGNN